MTFFEKYPQLQDKEFLTDILTETVFATMALENQTVPEQKIKQIVLSVLEEEELKGFQFLQNKIA